MKLTVRLAVVRPTIARQGRKANRQTRYSGAAQVAVQRPAGGGHAAAPVRSGVAGGPPDAAAGEPYRWARIVRKAVIYDAGIF